MDRVKIMFLCAVGFGLFGTAFSDRKALTIAGELSVVERVAFKQYDLMLNGKTLISSNADGNRPIDGWPMMSIMADIKNQVGDFCEIIIVKHSMLGNACNNGPIRLIALRLDGEITITEPIVHCRNNSPVLIVNSGEVLIYYKRYGNKKGDAEDEELWIFKNGRLLKCVDKNMIGKVRQVSG